MRSTDADTTRVLKRIAAGDHHLVDILYERYFPLVYNYLRAVLDSPSDAEDVSHQVFEAMLEFLSTDALSSARSLRSWLFAVARTRAIDYRRKHRRVDVVAPTELMGHMTGPEHAQEEPGDRSIFDPDLAAVLRTLPMSVREVVLLRYVGDLDLAAIAEILGTTEDSVKQAHRRALISLRDRLPHRATEVKRRRRPLEMRRHQPTLRGMQQRPLPAPRYSAPRVT